MELALGVSPIHKSHDIRHKSPAADEHGLQMNFDMMKLKLVML